MRVADSSNARSNDSSEIAALEGNLAADASAPSIGGDSISIGFDG